MRIAAKAAAEPATCELCDSDEETPGTFQTVEGFLVCPACSTSPKLAIMRKESDDRLR